MNKGCEYGDVKLKSSLLYREANAGNVFNFQKEQLKLNKNVYIFVGLTA